MLQQLIIQHIRKHIVLLYCVNDTRTTLSFISLLIIPLWELDAVINKTSMAISDPPTVGGKFLSGSVFVDTVLHFFSADQYTNILCDIVNQIFTAKVST